MNFWRRLINRLFPVYTKCQRCEDPFEKPQRFAFCQRCWAGMR